MLLDSREENVAVLCQLKEYH